VSALPNVGRGRLHTIMASAARGARDTSPLEVKVTNARLGDTECVRLDGRSEDRGATMAEGRVLILEVHEFYCPSPVTSMVVITLTYSQRFVEGTQPLPTENEITPFLNSMKFRL
jgi:hypothetical protein